MHKKLHIIMVLLALLDLAGAALLVVFQHNPKLLGSAGTVRVSNAQCTTNADCMPAGCSSQLCVPASQKDIVTTCEFSSAYACVKLTTCGCNAGVCGWASNDAYAACLENVAK